MANGPDFLTLARLFEAINRGAPKPWDVPMGQPPAPQSPQPPAALTPPPSYEQIANPNENEQLIRRLMEMRETLRMHPWVQKLKGVVGGPGQTIER